jgi:hypothetical protein
MTTIGFTFEELRNPVQQETIKWINVRTLLNEKGLYPELKRYLDTHQAKDYADQLRVVADICSNEMLELGAGIPWETLVNMKKERLAPYIKQYNKAEKEITNFIKNSPYKDVMKQPGCVSRYYYNVSGFFP